MRELIKNSGTRTAQGTRRMQAKRAGHWSATFGRVDCMLEVTGMENRHMTGAMFHITVLFKTQYLQTGQLNMKASSLFCRSGVTWWTTHLQECNVHQLPTSVSTDCHWNGWHNRIRTQLNFSNTPIQQYWLVNRKLPMAADEGAALVWNVTKCLPIITV
jgi:hypothetical protein